MDSSRRMFAFQFRVVESPGFWVEVLTFCCITPFCLSGMEDQVAMASLTSSLGTETLGKICDPLSQSSKNDVVVSVQGPCIGRSTPSQTSKCELCSKNVATLFIKVIH